METGNSNSNSNSSSQKSSHKRTSSGSQIKPILSNSNSNSGLPDAKKQKTSEFLCKVKYFNNLPPIPFDPKFLNYPFDKLRYIRYSTTSLDKNYKQVLHNEPDLGINIDLIDPQAYRTPSKNITLAEEDEKLLNLTKQTDAEALATKSPLSKGRTPVRAAVSWLKKTQYISGAADTTRTKITQVETRTGIRQKGEKHVLTRDQQLQAIEETFKSSKLPPKHDRNPDLVATEILPVFPNFELWANSYNQVVVEKEYTDEETEQLKLEAIIKAYTGETKNKFFAYLIPKKNTNNDENSEQNGKEEEEIEYAWSREYSYDVIKGQSFLDCYIFSFGKDDVKYNEISTRINLSKLKSKERAQPSKITVRHKPLTEQEQAKRDTAKLIFQKQPEIERFHEQDEEIRDDPEDMKDE